uniref:Variant surface glycoprotein 1125.4209 n=1 Tax=Trypanosoma brucei TaxID=5691 RepID=M4SX65_9TRYP|nr:variant surface glycoprotein 496 [Trypanosoma brucei]APD74736.1 variant surface glycoprotein 1125.4209 [Trypanosoma brucei]
MSSHWRVYAISGLLAAIHQVLNIEAAAHTNAKNLADLNFLCRIIALADADSSHLANSELTVDSVSELMKLNMTFSSEDWRSKFPKPAQPAEDLPAYCKEASDKPKCKLQYAKWEQAARKSENKENLPNRIVYPAKRINSIQGRTARLLIQAALKRAIAIEENYNNGAKQIIAKFEENIRKKLEQAIYGQQKTGKTATDICVVPAQNDRQTSCTLKKTADTVCGTAICLCAKESGSQTGKVCGAATHASDVNFAGPSVAAGYQSIHEQCKQSPKSVLTSSYIESLVAAFYARLQTKAHNTRATIYLGTAPNNQDCRAEDNQACVDFTDLSEASASAKIPATYWPSQLLQVAQDLRQVERALDAKKQVEDQLTALQKEGEKIYSQLQHKEGVEVPTTKANVADTASGKTTKCTKQNKTVEECPTEHCNYEKEKGCIPKTVKDSAVATGDTIEGTTTTTTTENCKGKEQKYCKSPGCKWEGETFKDSSFLLDKKLAQIAAL